MNPNRKVKLVNVITGLNQGGAEAMLLKLLPGLHSRFDVHVVSLMDEGVHGERIEQMGITLHCLRMKKGGFPGIYVLRLGLLLKQLAPDVIQSWMYHSNLMVSIVRMLTRGKYVIVWNVRHSLSDLSHEKWMTRQVVRANCFLSRSVPSIVYNSKVACGQHEEFGFSSDNSLIIPNGIDLKSFLPSFERRDRVRSELGIPDESIVIGHVARLHPMKNHEGFLRVAANLAKKNRNVHFILAGRNVTLSSGSLAALVPEELRCQFHLLGAHSDVSDLMSAMDVFCLSSLWGEAFPNVLGEAMASGVPCVATDVGDSSLIVGDTGVVVPPWDEAALAAGIEIFLTMSLEERRALGASARIRIEENFTLAAVIERYAALYGELLAKNGVN